MNRVVVVLCFATLGAVQMGCAVDPCQMPNTGKNGKLSFVQFSGIGEQAQGMMAQVELLRGPPDWDTKPQLLTRLGNTCIPLDDADIEVTLPAAFGTEPVTLVREPAMPVLMEFKCTAPAGEKQEVNVTVAFGGKVQYEDVFDITCQALEAAAPKGVELADLNVRSLTGNGYAVGGKVYVDLGMSNAQGPLIGFGATPADELLSGTGTHDRLLHDSFVAAAAGQNPVLQVGPLQAVLPITLVDPSEWTVSATTVPAPPTGLIGFSAWPVKADGTQLDGMEDCRWELFSATRSKVLDDTLCTTYQPPTFPGTTEPVTKMCVTWLDRSSCVDVTPV
jgi:hypothetical protein